MWILCFCKEVLHHLDCALRFSVALRILRAARHVWEPPFLSKVLKIRQKNIEDHCPKKLFRGFHGVGRLPLGNRLLLSKLTFEVLRSPSSEECNILPVRALDLFSLINQLWQLSAMGVPAVSMESSVRRDWLWSNEIFDLPAEAWPHNSTFCSLTAFLDALVTSMYLVGDAQSFKRLKESFHRDALLDSYFS